MILNKKRWSRSKILFR